MSLNYLLALLSILIANMAWFDVYAADDKTQIKVGVVIKASSQCGYNYSLEKNDSYLESNSFSSRCKTNNDSIKNDLRSIISKTNQDGQRYRVMMIVQ